MDKQKLDVAWAEVCAIKARGRKLYIDANIARERQEMDNWGVLFADSADSTFRAAKIWLAAVHQECGPDVMIEWPGDGSCIVAGVMLFLPIEETQDE